MPRFYAFKFLISLQLWISIWVLYLQQDRGLSLTQITLLDVVFWMVIVLSEVPTGALADRWGRKLSLALGALSFAGAIFLFGVAQGYGLLLLSYLVWAVSTTLTSGADAALIYDSLAQAGRGGELSRVLGRANACEMTGFLLGGLVGPPLAAVTSLSFPIVASAGITLLGAAAVLTMREPPHSTQAQSLAYVATIRAALGYVIRHPTLRWMIALNALVGTVGMMWAIFVQPFLSAYDVPVAEFGLITTPMRLAGIAGALVTARLAARLGERGVCYGVVGAMFAALLVLVAVPSLLAVSMFGVLMFCTSVFRPVQSAYVTRHAPAHLRATVPSVSQMAFSLMLAVTEPAQGAVADRVGLRAVFLLTAVLLGVFGLLVLLLWTRSARREASSAVIEEPAAAHA